jgi:hypothetical protein
MATKKKSKKVIASPEIAAMLDSPPQSNDNWLTNPDDDNSIFVQIASYRDPQLIPTLNDLMFNATRPHDLSVVVCWQHGAEQTLNTFVEDGFNLLAKEKAPEHLGDYDVHVLSKNGMHVKLMDVHYNDSQGACWARNAIQQFYNDHRYTLQLDSHHRFVKHWDSILIDMIERIRPESPKPLITGYIPSFDPENDPAGRNMIPWKMDFDRFIPEGTVFFLPASIDNWQERNGKPMKARFYSAHFAFADGIFANEVQHDPFLFFHSEEMSIAVRAFTHGYDLYHPTVLVAWHEYTRKGRVKIWDDHTTPQKNKGKVPLDWVQRNDASHKRNRTLFGTPKEGEILENIDFGKYGFGNVRTVRQYEEYVGLGFKYHGVQQETLDKKEPPNTFKYETEEQWKNSFVRSNDIRICFPVKELGEIEPDFDFWFVGAHDSSGKEIFRKDAVRHEIVEYVKNEFLDFRLIFLSNEKPATYTVWTHSASKGWLTKVDKVVAEY